MFRIDDRRQGQHRSILVVDNRVNGRIVDDIGVRFEMFAVGICAIHIKQRFASEFGLLIQRNKFNLLWW